MLTPQPTIDMQNGPTVVGPFPIGVDNRHAPSDIPKGGLRDAVNVEITDNGEARSAKAFTPVLDVPGLQKLFEFDSQLLGLFSGHLDRLDGARTTLATFAPLSSYTVVVGDGYLYIDDLAGGVIVGADGSLQQWYVPEIDTLPTAPAPDPNSLAGQRRYCVTRALPDGRESGVSLFGVTAGVLPVTISGAPTDSLVNFYISGPDGEALYFAGQSDSGAFTVSEEPAGHALRTAWKTRPPQGSVTEDHYGRLLIAVGPTVYVSSPYAPHLFDLEDCVQFNADVTLLSSANGGLYVGADKMHFLADLGKDSSTSMKTLSDMPPYPGSYCVGGNSFIYWMNSEGVWQGDNDGQIAKISTDNWLPPAFSNMAASYYKQDGFKGVFMRMFSGYAPAQAAREDLSSMGLSRDAVVVNIDGKGASYMTAPDCVLCASVQGVLYTSDGAVLKQYSGVAAKALVSLPQIEFAERSQLRISYVAASGQSLDLLLTDDRGVERGYRERLLPEFGDTRFKIGRDVQTSYATIDLYDPFGYGIVVKDLKVYPILMTRRSRRM